MAYRTVNLKPGTYRRLAAYKVAGISFDEAVALIMDEVGPQVIKQRVLHRLEAEHAPLASLDAPDGVEEEQVEFREARKENRGRLRFGSTP